MYNFNLPGSLEIPEVLLRTVRLSVTCKSYLEIDQKFMVRIFFFTPWNRKFNIFSHFIQFSCFFFQIAVLITGVQNNIKHVRTVQCVYTYVSKTNPTLNIDNLLPYDELELSTITLSPHLIGKDRNLLNLQVIIIPMSVYTCYNTIPFEFK